MRRREFVKSISALGAGILLRPGSSLALQEPHLAPTPDTSVKRVLVMFKCHFDAGFIDTQTAVVHKYFNQYFPAAIQIAATQNADPASAATPGPPAPGCSTNISNKPPPKIASAWKQAIAQNHIAWHALPFTWQTEMLSPSMIEGGLAISRLARQALRPRHHRREDDRRSRPYSRPHRSARQTRREIPRYRRERRQHSRQRCRRCFYGRTHSAHPAPRFQSCITTDYGGNYPRSQLRPRHQHRGPR